MSKNWRRTVEAALAEESSAWSMIWTLASEAFDRDPAYKDISSGRAIEEIRLELEDAGISLSFKTIQNRALVGKMAHSTTKRDSDVLRSVPWTVVRTAMMLGASAEATVGVIRKCRSEGKTPTVAVMQAEFASPHVGAGASSASSSSPFSDDTYLDAAATIASHRVAEQRGDYTPGAMARLAGVLLGQMLVGQAEPVEDWDGALEHLMATEGGE